MRRSFLLAVAAAFLAGTGCGSQGGEDNSGSGGGGGGTGGTGTVGATGGSVSHPSGVTVQVPAGALGGDVALTIAPVSLPQALPSGISAAGDAYRVEMGTATLSKPATIRFPVPPAAASSPAGALRFYRWDGQLWTSAGGVVSGNTIRTGTRAWSIWVLGTGPSLHKPFDFWNECCYDANVYVHQYFLRHPDLDAPINPLWGFPAFVNSVPHERAVFPQGCYSFCVDWTIPPTSTNPLPSVWHEIVGKNPPPVGNWDYCLDENSNDLVPPIVQFTTEIGSGLPGPCGPSQNVGSGGGVPVSLAGTWTLFLRCVTQVNPAMSFTFAISAQGGSFTGSGSGTDYTGIPLTGTVQGGYYASTNTLSGTVSISSGATLIRVDNFSAPLVSDTGYVRFTVTSHTGFEGCTLEGRFVKQ